MIEPVRLIAGGVAVDDRGQLAFANDFNFAVAGVKRFYQVSNHRRGFIRAWHGHQREAKYVWAASGSAIVAAVPLDAQPGDLGAVQRFVLSATSPKVLFIPAGYYNGFMNLTDDTILQFFSTSTLEQSKGDDIRQPFDRWNVWDVEYR